MQPWFYMLGAQKNHLIETVLSIPTTYVLVENIYICIFPFLKRFLSKVTVLINSRERQHN